MQRPGSMEENPTSRPRWWRAPVPGKWAGSDLHFQPELHERISVSFWHDWDAVRIRSIIPRRCEVPIFTIPSIPPWKALIGVAVVILIMVLFRHLFLRSSFGALMLYILSGS
jgi:hypothetical protein